ncbi:MAG: hypothetical protein ACOCP8_02375 [archaeon]
MSRKTEILSNSLETIVKMKKNIEDEKEGKQIKNIKKESKKIINSLNSLKGKEDINNDDIQRICGILNNIEKQSPMSKKIYKNKTEYIKNEINQVESYLKFILYKIYNKNLKYLKKY